MISVHNAPVMLSLKEDYVVGIPGEARAAVPFIRNLMMQVVLTHSYDEVKIVLLLDVELAKEFDFARYLPHLWDDDQSIRYFVTTRSEASQLSEFLSREMESVVGESDKKIWLRKHPAYLIFAMSKDLFDCVEVLKELMFQEEYCGVSIAAAFDGVPKECTNEKRRSPQPAFTAILLIRVLHFFAKQTEEKALSRRARRFAHFLRTCYGSHR